MWSALLVPLSFSLASASPLKARTSSNSYDYIVVGGGAGGLVVANRLSETNATVLVIEAGDAAFNNPNVTATDGYGLALNTQIDWQYPAVAQNYSNGTAPVLHAGKALGGSTTINGMSFTRVDAAQLDVWEAIGNKGWNWNNLFRYYKKSEHYQMPGSKEIEGGASYVSSVHGYNGPLKVGYPEEQSINDFLAPLNASYQEIGVPYSPDVSGGNMRGFNVFPMMIDVDEDVREDAARAYYYPYQSRANLHIVFNTTATRLIWSEDDAEGNAVVSAVEIFAADGTTQNFTANREVILSAGALRTPSLLELSGIGNPEILSKINIPTKVSLSGVGENLIDQINNGIRYANSANKTYTGLFNYVSYPNVTDVFGADEAATLASTVLNALPSYAAAIAAQNNNATNETTLLTLMKYQHSLLFESQVPVAEILHEPSSYQGSEYWGTLPFARGNIHITSADPNTPAAINPNYFMFDFDTQVQIGVAKFYRKLFATSALSDFVGKETFPGTAAVAANAGDDVWTDWIKNNWRPNYHVLSTAIMMPRDMGGVVSERLRVYGTKNLRVVDGSVLPFQVCGHLTSTIIAIAERASDLIKEDAGLL